MSPEAQRVAIAEWMGLLEPPKCKPSIEQLEAILADTSRNLKVDLLPSGEIRAVPDYTNDLNAMWTAEELLQAGDDCVTYRNWLERLSGSAWHATATQRCEALLRTLDLWSEA